MKNERALPRDTLTESVAKWSPPIKAAQRLGELGYALGASLPNEKWKICSKAFRVANTLRCTK